MTFPAGCIAAAALLALLLGLWLILASRGVRQRRGDGSRNRVENTDELRACVLDMVRL